MIVDMSVNTCMEALCSVDVSTETYAPTYSVEPMLRVHSPHTHTRKRVHIIRQYIYVWGCNKVTPMGELFQWACTHRRAKRSLPPLLQPPLRTLWPAICIPTLQATWSYVISDEACSWRSCKASAILLCNQQSTKSKERLCKRKKRVAWPYSQWQAKFLSIFSIPAAAIASSTREKSKSLSLLRMLSKWQAYLLFVDRLRDMYDHLNLFPHIWFYKQAICCLQSSCYCRVWPKLEFVNICSQIHVASHINILHIFLDKCSPFAPLSGLYQVKAWPLHASTRPGMITIWYF